MSTATAPLQAVRLEWFDAIARRVSRRRFDGRKVDSAVLDRVDETCRRVSEGRDGRAVLVRHAPQDIFTGFVGSYGRVIDAPSLVALVGSDESLIDVGYVGEAVILEATLAGLDTCWIAATFSATNVASIADLRPGERVCAVTPLGYATEAKSRSERLAASVLHSRSRLSTSEIAPGSDTWPEWAREAAEAVRVAPSGANRQPWRLRLEGDALVIAPAPKVYWTAPLDYGIAKLHAELGALHAGVSGGWEMLFGPDVARFSPTQRSGS